MSCGNGANGKGKSRGRVVPIVDFNRCEGKGDCIDACPFDVFEIQTIAAADFEKLSLLGKFRSKVHGGKVAYTPQANACEACGLCVRACPERAIKLVSSASMT